MYYCTGVFSIYARQYLGAVMLLLWKGKEVAQIICVFVITKCNIEAWNTKHLGLCLSGKNVFENNNESASVFPVPQGWILLYSW